MDFKTKRHCKRMAKLFFILAYGMVGCFVLMLIVLFTPLIDLILMKTNPTMNCELLAFIIFFSPIFLGIIFGLISQPYLNERVHYKNAIKEYRQHKFFQQVIALIRTDNNDDYEKAIDIYNRLIDKKDRSAKNILYTIILTSSLYSNDPKRKTLAEKRLKDVLDIYDPLKIKF